jgi:regulator of sigma E protease
MLDLLQSAALNVWYVVLVAIFFGGSIFVHELGHFLAARWRGLKIDRFSIGFGRKIVSWTRNGVEYRLSWIPLGGYVALPQLADMRGIEGDPSNEATRLPPISYTDKMIVSVAGAVFNVIFAFLLACVLWGVKQPVSAESLSTTIGYVSRTISERQPDGTVARNPSPASAAGLRVGDRILQVDDREIENWNDISSAVAMGGGWSDDGRREARFVIEREGKTLELFVHPRRAGELNVRHVGISPAAPTKVATVPKGSIAERIGLQRDDYLVSIGGTPITHVNIYLETLSSRTDEPLDLVVRRGEQNLTLSIPPRPHPRVYGIERNSLAHEHGLQLGDILLAVDETPITSASGFTELVGKKTAEPLTLTVSRGGETHDIRIPARSPGQKIGIVPSQELGESHSTDEIEIRIAPHEQIVGAVKDGYRSLSSMLDPRTDIGPSLMSGPIEIVRVFHQVAQLGIRHVFWLTIMINISLAIFNVLPIPVLDGGHMMFATITKLRGRPISGEFLLKTQAFFMILLLSMIVYVSYFNVDRWVRDASRTRAFERMIWEGQDLPPFEER